MSISFCQEPCNSTGTFWCFQHRHAKFKFPLSHCNYPSRYVGFKFLYILLFCLWPEIGVDLGKVVRKKQASYKPKEEETWVKSLEVKFSLHVFPWRESSTSKRAEHALRKWYYSSPRLMNHLFFFEERQQQISWA